MAGTRSLHDCQALVNAITAAQGRVPDVLGYILSGAALLEAHSVSVDPAKGIVDAVVAGELTEESLTGLIAEATTKQSEANYTGDLRQRISPLLAAAFHQALKDGGAADKILQSLKKPWDEAAEQVAAAKAMGINSESTLEHIVATGEDGLVTAWRGLRDHLEVIGAIGAIASSFGPRSATFPLITEYALSSDPYRPEDRAVFCSDGDLGDSAVFRGGTGTHRDSPWFKVPLRLHSVRSATERYEVWAANQWDLAHPNPVIQQQRPDGSVAEVTLVNPYRKAA